MKRTVIITAALWGLCGAALADDKAEILAAMQSAEKVSGHSCKALPLNLENALKGNYYGGRYFEIRYRDPDGDESIFPLVQLDCAYAAYNTSFIFLSKTPGREGRDYNVLSFAEPKLAYDYTDATQSALKSPPRVVGYTAITELMNAEFDPTTNTLSTYAYWRGFGDAWQSGEWRFMEGQFVLTRVEVSPTAYDSDAIRPAMRPPSYTVHPETSAVTRND